MRKRRLFLILLLGLFSATPRLAQASVELGSDIFVSALTGRAAEVHLRTRTSLYVGLRGFAVGAIVKAEPQHSYLLDLGYGAAVRFGERTTLELEAGLLDRTFDGDSGAGIFGGVVVGWRFTRNFRIAIPITYKRVVVGSDARSTIDYLPYLGFRVVF